MRTRTILSCHSPSSHQNVALISFFPRRYRSQLSHFFQEEHTWFLCMTEGDTKDTRDIKIPFNVFLNPCLCKTLCSRKSRMISPSVSMTGPQQLPLGWTTIHSYSWIWLWVLNQGQLQCQLVPLAVASPTMVFEEMGAFFQKKKKTRQTNCALLAQ